MYYQDAYAQCPPSYIYMGGRCLQFQTDTGMTFEEAIGACNINGGRLAKINDCNLLGEVARYLGDNGDYIITCVPVPSLMTAI